MTTTGQAAAMLGVTEPKLQELVRRGVVTPSFRGRFRSWAPTDIAKAAAALGKPCPPLKTAAPR